MKSALFVDFDNVYSGLRQLDQTSADRFALKPMEWMNWVIDSLALPEHVRDDARRRVLVRRCYLNPQAYQRFRPSFNLAGFEIIDCPALTSGGKTSTDIHMVLDIIDLLQHEAHYDEFIVFSADADFTPVLRKLRRWDRRTTVLAIGFPSAAYRASADLLIDQDDFVRNALGFGDELKAVPQSMAITQNTSGIAAPKSTISTPTLDVPKGDEELRHITEIIKRAVADANEPVACGKLATLITSQHSTIADDWNGKGTFRKFVESLELAPIMFDWNGSGGCAYDIRRSPETAEHGQKSAIDEWGHHHELLPIAKQIHEVTGTPLLSPRKYRSLFESIAADVAARPFDFIDSGKSIRDRCRDSGQPVSRADVTFVLRGLLMRGHAFDQGKNEPHILSRTLADNVRSLCLREQIVLDRVTENAISKWIGGSE
jgi:hypothetical protein